MIDLEHIETFGWEAALRGMRNPLDSWDRADSLFNVPTLTIDHDGTEEKVLDPVLIGENDESLMRRLIGQGTSDHCKFRRMIGISVDVTAPRYWWTEADTYKVGTTANSCSTMHTIMSKPFTEDMFSWERMSSDSMSWKYETLRRLNEIRSAWHAFKQMGEEGERTYPGQVKLCWDTLIQTLPQSFNQRRTWMLNYEVMSNIYHARRHHKLQEWHDFIDIMLEQLPYPWIFTGRGC